MMPIEVTTIETPSLGDRSYIASDGRRAVVIDPQRDIDRILEGLDAQELELTHVLETHIHNDYVSGGLELSRRLGARYVISADDVVAFERTPIGDGDVLHSGTMAVRAVHTPGHTPTHLAYVLSDARRDVAVFTGGSLLYGTVGRTDLIGDRLTDRLTRQQWRSARRLVTGLAADVVVHPTHGFGSFCALGPPTAPEVSTIGAEATSNLAMRVDDENSFVEQVLAGLTAYPRYYAHMAPINRSGPQPLDLTPPRPLDADELRARISSGEWVIDVRDRQAFAHNHLAGTLAIERVSLPTYLGWLIPWGTAVVLVADSPAQLHDAQRMIARIGIDRPVGQTTFDRIGPQDLEHRSYPIREFSDLASASSERPVTVLDVRRDEEWARGHLSGALHVPLHDLPDRLQEIPRGQVWVHCASGQRAAIAAAFVDRLQDRQVALIDDDFERAAAAGLEIEPPAADDHEAQAAPGWREPARRWRELDPDAETRAELTRLLAAEDDAALADRFSRRLEFGTAGLRGALGAGPNRMNRVVVRQTSAGVCARLGEEAEATSTIVVVGHDARRKSDVFARDVVGVFAAAGFDIRYWPEPVPTPLLAYAVRWLGAGAGIQITASHNPPSDNGYKVYWRGGGQITPPLDAEIAAAVEEAPTPATLPADAGRPLSGDVLDAYRSAVLALAPLPEQRDLRIVYTPLHGVAGSLLVDVLQRAGFHDVRVVAEQFDPDPDFPTVRFPNPEEPGALDLALQRARATGADLVLANDPDGDRIAAALPAADGWRVLSGDEIGCLLADYLLAEAPGGPERMVATTVVSSQLLARIAQAHGVGYTETLTGLKWLARAAMLAERDGRRMVLGYEEALGVMIGDVVRDKDGISAALVLADCAATERARGRSLLDRLDDLARRFGLHATAQTSVRHEPEDGLAARILTRLRSDPPAAVAGVAVAALSDYLTGDRRLANGSHERLDIPRAELVGLQLVDGTRLQVRPSGTEPKLKLYMEVVEQVDNDVRSARGRANARLQVMRAGFFEVLGLAEPNAS